MANDDEFDFKSLAESFKPEIVKKEESAKPVKEVAAKEAVAKVSQPVSARPVTPSVAMPSLPQVNPSEVAASVPQTPVPELPPIQNPVFNPEFQKAAGVASLPAILGGAALGASALYGAQKARKAIKDRQILSQQPANTPTDNPIVPTPTTEAPPPVHKDAPLLARGLENTAANAMNQQVESLQKAGAVPGSTAPVAVPTPVTPPAAPAAAPTVTEAITTGQNPTQAIQTEVAKQIDATPTQPVEPPKNKGGRPSKAAKEAQLAEGVFKEGFGGADNWMQSQVGHDIRRFIKDEFNAGKPYGGGQAAMEKAYADIGRYEQWLKENIPVQTLNKAERKAVGVPSPEPHGPLGKAMKVGGVAGLLMTAANAANAKEAMRNVGEAILPIGMTPSELASGTLTEKQLRAFQESQKLGSPYRSVPPPR